MIVGFTGTRRGMTYPQEQRLIEALKQYEPNEFHHGGCCGADAEAHILARDMGAKVFVHPSTLAKFHGYHVGAHYVHPMAPPLRRNKSIVNACDVLFAAPLLAVESTRSGTWATIRYARKRGIQVVMLWP